MTINTGSTICLHASPHAKTTNLWFRRAKGASFGDNINYQQMQDKKE